MARYLYHCRACAQTHEIEKSMDRAGDSEACPKCQGPTERVFTAPSLTHKGGEIRSGESPASGGCAGGCCGGVCGMN